MVKQPIAEVFGFPVNNQSERALRHRTRRLCPFNNRVPNCTKDKANDPLGVCSIFDAAGNPVITCPVRFRQDWIVADDAAQFFFGTHTTWTSLTEVRLSDRDGVSAGNIDLVLVSYDERGRLIDFGGLEIQAVYISGNIRTHFEQYMANSAAYLAEDRSKRGNAPRADYLSSSRKRLLPQLLYKGSILKDWGKKQAVAINRGFYDTLPPFEEVDAKEADIAWLIYDLVLDQTTNQYVLSRYKSVYTRFQSALEQIATPKPGSMQGFISHLQSRLDEKLENGGNAPDAPILDENDLT